MIKSIALGALLAVSTAFAGTAPSAKGTVAPLPPVGCSPTISYTNIQADWVHVFGDDGPDADGADLTLNYSPIDHVYGTGSISTLDGNWSYGVGAGVYTAIANNVDLVLEAGALLEDEENAFYARPHLRARFGCLEVHAGAKYYNYADQLWAGFATIYYEVAANTDFAVGGTFTEDANSITVGLRYKF
jgi:opacity protein-like surface antigen